jgi:uncharacterized membrane protein YkoI
MKIRYVTTAALALSLLTGCMGTKNEKEGDHHESKAELMAEAKVSEADARQTAMARVPNGDIKEAELEREDGHLQWSFDIATPDTKDITEVNVDAITGGIINISKEKPENEKAEKDKD